MQEWDSYKCNVPTRANTMTNSCSELTEVRHIVHVPDVRRIIEDGKIRSGLIYDESRLNKSRRCVVWLSANTWGPGSIYGNVELVFDWKKLVRKKNVYWVEAMKGYSPDAYRFLITSYDRSSSKHLMPYDPAKDGGPLRKFRGKWYWNSKYTSEFMIEDDLILEDCIDLNFIKHHERICRMYGSKCRDKNANVERTARRILAFLLSNKFSSIDDLLIDHSDDSESGKLNWAGEAGVNGIWRSLTTRVKFSGGIKKRKSRQLILRGALSMLGRDQLDDAKQMISLLHSVDVFEDALREVISEHFDFEEYDMPD